MKLMNDEIIPALRILVRADFTNFSIKTSQLQLTKWESNVKSLQKKLCKLYVKSLQRIVTK